MIAATAARDPGYGIINGLNVWTVWLLVKAGSSTLQDLPKRQDQENSCEIALQHSVDIDPEKFQPKNTRGWNSSIYGFCSSETK